MAPAVVYGLVPGEQDTCLWPGLSVRFAVCFWPGLIVHGLSNWFKHAVPGWNRPLRRVIR